MLRVRFETSSVDDPRPVLWPPLGPYWVTGQSDSAAIIVAYVPEIEDVERFWPEAEKIDNQGEAEITFSGRFPKPKWWQE